MDKDWLLLIQKFDLESSRSKFESICERLYKKLNPDKSVRTVQTSQGDGGIDIFIGEIGVEPIDVIQCKFFASGIGDPQKKQIRESFKTAVEHTDYKTKSWTLCIINRLDLHQNIWWNGWKSRMEEKHQLDAGFIRLKDGNEIINMLKEHNLHSSCFEMEDSLKLEEIHTKIVKDNVVPQAKIEDVLRKASYPLMQARNFFQDKTLTHIERSETAVIYDWIMAPLQAEQKNVLVLKGERGAGKSAIQRDLYERLEKENYRVVGIKADKFYAASLAELQHKLFGDVMAFDMILEDAERNDAKFIVIIDQIDALSLTLSSSREFIETYNHLIACLQDNRNARVIISSRSYDLKYDAELSIYSADVYKKINVNLLDADEVKKVLSEFGIGDAPQKVLELLRTPNNLDIYCRIFDGSFKKNLDAVSSLKDLYDQLWSKYISSRKTLNLKNLIYLIAGKMYAEQRISVGNIYEDEFYQELLYLNSNSLLVEFNGEIQFFHQTFYEYCFARYFVENNRYLEEFILENEQSLYVRSVIKMVLEYQREYHLGQYMDTVQNILSLPLYRFHVKSLIINIIGAAINPVNSEKKLVLELILKDIEYEEAFMGSVSSKNWVQFLISEGIPGKYFDALNDGNYTDEEFQLVKEKWISFNWAVFRNNMNNSALIILDYLDALEFEDKDYFILRLLIQIEDWSDTGLIPYFEKYMAYKAESRRKRDNFWYFEIVKKIFPHNMPYAFEHLQDAVAEIYQAHMPNDDFDYSLNEAVKEFNKKAPDETFQFLFEAYRDISGKTMVPYFKEAKTSTVLFKSYKLDISEMISDQDVKNIKNYLYDYVKNCSNKVISDLFAVYKDSNSIFILTVLLRGINRGTAFSGEIMELLSSLKEKNAFDGPDDNFQLEIRNLIADSYAHMDKNQTAVLDELLLSIKSIYDYHIYTDSYGIKKVSMKEYGKKKYLYLKALPLEILNKQGMVYKTREVLHRKFGEVDHKKALHVSKSQWGAVGPPLEESAYQNMDLKSWKRSMLIFNETYRSDKWLKGDMHDHSIAFRNAVKEKPEKFYDFIDSLFDDPQVSSLYLIYGIGGLIEGRYDPEKVKKVYKKLLNLNPEGDLQRTYLNHYPDYFIKNKNVDAQIVAYLADTALRYTDDGHDRSSMPSLDYSINTTWGGALYSLMNCSYDPAFEEIIFSTVENLIRREDCGDALKITVLFRLAFLNRINLPRAFKIFKELTDTGNVEVLRASLHCGQYFNNQYHSQMQYYFKRLMQAPELHKKSYMMVSSWLRGFDRQKQLYRKFTALGKDAKICAVDVAEEFLIKRDGMVNFKALEILAELTAETDPDFGPEYSGIILRKFKPHNFIHFRDFLEKYSRSPLCGYEPAYFMQYLLQCAKEHPKACIELIGNLDFSRVPDIQKGGYYDREPVQLVLGIYSKLVSEVVKDKKLINKALDIFDNILKNSHLRTGAAQGMESML